MALRLSGVSVGTSVVSGVAVDLDARLRTEVDGTREDVIETRRALHRHPELSLQERETAELVARRSADLGFTVRTGVGGTGVLADLDSGRPGPMLMLRADMDALPIVERGDERVVSSAVDGVMHACGHDGHVAMTLGAATALVALRDAGRDACASASSPPRRSRRVRCR